MRTWTAAVLIIPLGCFRKVPTSHSRWEKWIACELLGVNIIFSTSTPCVFISSIVPLLPSVSRLSATSQVSSSCASLPPQLPSSSSPQSHLIHIPGFSLLRYCTQREGPGLSSFLSHKRPLCFPPLCFLGCHPTPFLNTPVVHSLPLPWCIPYWPLPAEESLCQRGLWELN